MFKQRVNEAEIEFSIAPVTPLLIKSADNGADPTLPDMEFVQTYYRGQQTVYLPGSSLKGAIRAHCERIIRTVGGEKPSDSPWACNPMDTGTRCRKPEAKEYPTIFEKSCFACRLFGSTESASHLTIGDAYPLDPVVVRLEERNCVALDRKLGSVAVGPFNFQVVTDGTFKSRIRLANFSLDQMALLGLAIRDFDTQTVSLGFAKSRGLGQISMKVDSIKIRYPGCVLAEGIRVLKTGKKFGQDEVLGAGALFGEAAKYGYATDEKVRVSVETSEDPFGIGVLQVVTNVDQLWKETVGCWRKQIKGGAPR